MVANLGYGTLIITFLVSIYGVVAAYLGARRHSTALVDSARNAMLLTFPLLSITALSLIYLLVNAHFEIQYVTEVSSNSMPLYLRVTALWGGQAGSLLFWSWLMAAFASAVTLRKWDRDREFLPWVDPGLPGHPCIFPAPEHLFRESICQLLANPHGQHHQRHVPTCRHKPLYSPGWQRVESAASTSRDDHPPAHALPGFCFIRHPLRICHGCPDHRAHG